ncbi:hypothetical protein ACJ73_10327 [Blastomyces percursus]|uniref:CCHC-type domain-containing protein n=1 Tax=Blastomyces percursus TaxID=1658174 RepID=A0A1J9P0R9_9EURO|nr:hypothetical protein ACJ73_10327 [Blastomyces percursus]
MPSGDLMLIADTPSTKAELAKSNEWVEKWGGKAHMRKEMYAVLIKSAPLKAVSWDKPEKAVEDVYRQNPSLRCRVLIHKVAKRAVKQQKPHGSVIMHVATPQQANKLVEEGIILGNEFCVVEIFHREAQVTRCYNCQRYGHIAKFCRRSAVCGHCAVEGHTDKNCAALLEGKKTICCNCKGEHPAWALNCPERRAAVEQAREALRNRPLRFVVQAADDEGWITPRKRGRTAGEEVQSSQRRVGRPTGVSKAGALQRGSLNDYMRSARPTDTQDQDMGEI